jgi:hypothetical protein
VGVIGEEQLVLSTSYAVSIFQDRVHLSFPLVGAANEKGRRLVSGGLGGLDSYEILTRGEAAWGW